MEYNHGKKIKQMYTTLLGQYTKNNEEDKELMTLLADFYDYAYSAGESEAKDRTSWWSRASFDEQSTVMDCHGNNPAMKQCRNKEKVNAFLALSEEELKKWVKETFLKYSALGLKEYTVECMLTDDVEFWVEQNKYAETLKDELEEYIEILFN